MLQAFKRTMERRFRNLLSERHITTGFGKPHSCCSCFRRICEKGPLVSDYIFVAAVLRRFQRIPIQRNLQHHQMFLLQMVKQLNLFKQALTQSRHHTRRSLLEIQQSSITGTTENVVLRTPKNGGLTNFKTNIDTSSIKLDQTNCVGITWTNI